MTNKTSIIVCGDQHGEFGELNSLIAKKSPEYVVLCGDVGFWPILPHTKDGAKVLRANFERNKAILESGQRLSFIHAIKPGKTKVLALPGNHEDYGYLNALQEKGGRVPLEVAENIFYMPRGSYYEFPDGRTALFMGGAFSIDYRYRVDGWDWFSKEEIISQEDIDSVIDMKYDIMFSHTCPDCMVDEMMRLREKDRNDPSTTALQILVDRYKPKLSIYGHWHKYVKRTIEDTTYVGLTIPGRTGWWMNL